jgi:hypothetical protein
MCSPEASVGDQVFESVAEVGPRLRDGTEAVEGVDGEVVDEGRAVGEAAAPSGRGPGT